MTPKPRFTRRAVLAGAGAAVASPYIWTSAQAQAGGAIKIGMPLALTGPLGLGRPAAEARRRVLRQAAERQGRHPRTQDRAPDRGHRRQSRHLRAQGAGDGGAPRLPPLHRHDAVVGGARGRAEARRVERDLRVVGQRRRPADRRELRAQLLPRQHLGADGRARGLALSARSQAARASMRSARLCLGPQQRAGVRGRDEARQARTSSARCSRRPAPRTTRPTSPRSASPAPTPVYLVLQGDDNNAFLSQSRQYRPARQGGAADRDRRSRQHPRGRRRVARSDRLRRATASPIDNPTNKEFVALWQKEHTARARHLRGRAVAGHAGVRGRHREGRQHRGRQAAPGARDIEIDSIKGKVTIRDVRPPGRCSRASWSRW